MRAAKVKFHRLDIFESCIMNEDFINENPEIIEGFENDCIILKDPIANNTEQLARFNILSVIKKEIDGIDLIENQVTKITHKDSVIPNELVAHVQNKDLRLICEIIEVKDLKA